MLQLLTVYVPYDPSLWQQWWNAVMKTIASTTGVGFVVFAAIFCIGIFKIVFRYFL